MDGPWQEGCASAVSTDTRYRTDGRETAQWESLPATVPSGEIREPSGRCGSACGGGRQFVVLGDVHLGQRVVRDPGRTGLARRPDPTSERLNAGHRRLQVGDAGADA